MRLIRWSLLLLSLTLVNFLPAKAGSKPPQVIFRVFVQTAGEGLPTTQAINIPLPPTGEIIQVRALPEITEHDIFDVKPDVNGGVILTLDHRGRVNLSATTGEDQGKIMVVMLNGVVIYAPVIDAQITNGVLEIPHPIDPSFIKTMQEMAKQNVRDAPPAPRAVE
jgi:hypothetical protein